MVSDERRISAYADGQAVLILVLMEYGLWLVQKEFDDTQVLGLNPCSNGIWSLTQSVRTPSGLVRQSLNPCSNGIWSLTSNGDVKTASATGLNPCSNGIWSLTQRLMEQGRSSITVLILVLMEYGLWQITCFIKTKELICLNPCSNGIWSLTPDSLFTNYVDVES